MRDFVRETADWQPNLQLAYLDPNPVEVYHMLYVAKWENRSKTTADTRAPLKISQFGNIWRKFKKKPFAHEGKMYQLQIRPARTGFTCKTCTRLRQQRSNATTKQLKDEVGHYIRLHLQQSREAREVYADHIYSATTIDEIASWAIDAADQVC